VSYVLAGTRSRLLNYCCSTSIHNVQMVTYPTSMTTPSACPTTSVTTERSSLARNRSKNLPNPCEILVAPVLKIKRETELTFNQKEVHKGVHTKRGSYRYEQRGHQDIKRPADGVRKSHDTIQCLEESTCGKDAFRS
jgi:hypothetical protein